MDLTASRPQPIAFIPPASSFFGAFFKAALICLLNIVFSWRFRYLERTFSCTKRAGVLRTEEGRVRRSIETIIFQSRSQTSCILSRYLDNIKPQSAAERAGVLPGDFLLKVFPVFPIFHFWLLVSNDYRLYSLSLFLFRLSASCVHVLRPCPASKAFFLSDRLAIEMFPRRRLTS